MRTPAWLEEMERAFCLLMSRMDDGLFLAGRG
jgi:hypothetical protein